MCDYSLEMYASRPARVGETLVTTRFPTGSIGMTSPGDPACAVCLPNQTVLKLDMTSPELAPFRERHGLREVEAVTFIRMESGVYRDGVRLENGMELSLQQLPVRIRAEVAEPINIQPKAVEPFAIPQIA